MSSRPPPDNLEVQTGAATSFHWPWGIIEGLMTEDIEDCLKVVLEALRKCDLAADEVIAWCSTMLESDRVRFVAREPLESLRDHFQRLAAQ